MTKAFSVRSCRLVVLEQSQTPKMIRLLGNHTRRMFFGGSCVYSVMKPTTQLWLPLVEASSARVSSFSKQLPKISKKNSIPTHHFPSGFLLHNQHQQNCQRPRGYRQCRSVEAGSNRSMAKLLFQTPKPNWAWSRKGATRSQPMGSNPNLSKLHRGLRFIFQVST